MKTKSCGQVKRAKKWGFSRFSKVGTLPARMSVDSCSLQGRVSRLEQRNLLQFARVPTKLSGGFYRRFFLASLDWLYVVGG
jgi:hypothetical protein